MADIRYYKRVTGSSVVPPDKETEDPTESPPSSIQRDQVSYNINKDALSFFVINDGYEYTVNVYKNGNISVFTQGVISPDVKFMADKTFIRNGVVINPLSKDLILYLFSILLYLRDTDDLSRFPWYMDVFQSLLSRSLP